MKTAIWLIAIAQWWTIGENRYYSWKFNKEYKEEKKYHDLEQVLLQNDWHRDAK